MGLLPNPAESMAQSGSQSIENVQDGLLKFANLQLVRDWKKRTWERAAHIPWDATRDGCQ
jgi:hypothetical protein